MSKIGQLALDLEEQVGELGFESLEDALSTGYEINYQTERLEKDGSKS